MEFIGTIKKVRMAGKWVEFWFEEPHATVDGTPEGYHKCSKHYRLWDAVLRAGLQEEIFANGYVGKKLIWELDGMNYEIKDFVTENTEWTKALTNRSVWTREQVDKMLNDVMNLGMMLRQHQLSGHDGRSGNEVLEEWKRNNM